MTGSQLQPAVPQPSAVDAFQNGAPPADWGGGEQPAAPEPSGPSFGRYLAALSRYKWLIIVLGVLGLGGGVAATRFIDPEYEVRATILLEAGNSREQQRNSPIQGAALLEAAGWQDLLRSFAIADPVVTNLGLFVTPAKAADSTLFRGFRVDQPRLRPGTYVLKVTGNKYVLTLRAGLEAADGLQVEEGIAGDSIGRPVGFQWQPSARSVASRQEVEFNVQTPREASIELISRMGMKIAPQSAFLFITLRGTDARRTATTLNAWVEQFVAVATALKKKEVTQVSTILEGQREYAAQSLAEAEAALESFRVRTVTEPSERQTIMPGIEMTNSPVFDAYFRDRVLGDNYKRDRTALERILENGRRTGQITREAVLSVPMVNADPAAENLRKTLAEQADREFVLRRLRESYTDEFQRVKDEAAALKALQTATLPNVLSAYIDELKLRESELNRSVEQSSKDLRSIPIRTIEEQRLKRQVEVAAEMYRNLNLKSAEAKLADAATVPDVTILDPAVAPLQPTQNTAPVIILGAFAVAVGLGVAIAILLDRLDKRFRYPEQVTNELGLFVLGAVPVIDAKKGRRSLGTAAQVVEAFRTIRMNVRYAADPSRPLAITVTSPGPSDGKSLVSSNLALSFAESGARTLLIDGDIRRGELSKTFGVASKPGLVEYLEGTALIAEVMQPVAAHPNLTLIPGGARKRRAPELLATPRLTQLLQQMSAEYDVVIVDSPPLGAGFDAFALGTATGNIALVMRVGVTDRKMAEAKLAVVDTLPIRVMGAVLNGVELTGAYKYYSYYQEYAADDEPQPARITDGAERSGTSVSVRS